MDLIQKLETKLSEEPSYFRAQLLKEDIARLTKLREIAWAGPTRDAFVKDGFKIEWTPSLLRIGEMKETLEPFLLAFYAAEQPAGDAEGLIDKWNSFDLQRMDILVGCLSRVPKVALD